MQAMQNDSPYAKRRCLMPDWKVNQIKKSGASMRIGVYSPRFKENNPISTEEMV